MPGRPWTLLPTPGAERHQGGSAPFSRLYGSRRRAGTDVFFMQKEEEKMKKRVISLLLALVLALGLLPTAAWAAETISDYFSDMPITAETEPGSPYSAKKWTVSTLDGETVLVSGNKGKSNSSSTLQLTMKDTVNLSFEYKVSTEQKFDKLTISNGGTQLVNGVSGLTDWTRLDIDAKQGDVISIVYKKDSSGDKNDDCVYLRNFTCGTPIVVTFHANGGTGADYTQNIYGGKGTLKANKFTKSGKVFAGWATSAGGAVVYADGAKITVESNTDLYAVWGDAYTVTFDYNDGKTSNATVDVAQDTAIGTKIPADPKKTGYIFAGWFNGEDKLTAKTVISSNITYTARWTANTYTIQFLPNDGTGTMDSIPAAYDQEITLPANGFTRDGYTFTGWGDSPSYSKYASGEAVNNLTKQNNAVVKLYAVWEGNPVKVTLNFNYKGAEPIERTGSVGSTKYYAKIDDPVRPGYIFDGWYDAAEGGNEIDYSYKFTAEDAENGKTLYAHWTKGITVHFDGNGYKSTIADKTVKPDEVFSKLPYLSSYSYPANKTLDGWYIKNDDGSFGEAVNKDTDFSSLDEVTLIAKWRDYQYIIKFNIKFADKSSVTGTMADQPAPFGQNVQLNKCAFTREGYDFAGWAISSYGSTVKYKNGDIINRQWDNWDSEDGEKYNLYAVWTQNVFGKAMAAIQSKLPTNNVVRTAGDLGLPTSGDGYTISYVSSNTELLSNSGAVTLPESGSAKVTLTATITDTKTSKTYTKEYILTLYSATTATTEAELNAAVSKLTGNFKPVYGTDTNAITAVEKKLLDAGCEGIAVSIKEAVTDSGNYSGIDQDGTIHYYFNPGMTKYGSYFYTTFVLSKNGASVEKEWYTNIDWDKAKVRETLNTVADTLTVPETATEHMKLPIRANGKTWTTVTWLSNDPALTVQSSSFSPYSITLNAAEDTTVVLTATVTCNSVDGVAVTREFECTVPGGTSTGVDYQAKLDNALSNVGLRDFVTGKKLTAENGVYTTSNDIQFPTTRDLKIDGKYTPVVITSSDPGVIEAPTTPNSARVYVYRPLPGEAAKTVTLTMKILDRPNGPQPGDDLSAMRVLASKEIKVTVQPLTQAEIDAEIALMERVKVNYWNGIRNANTDQNNVTTDLHAFQECYLGTDGSLTWAYDRKDLKNHGIVPVPLDNWYDQQIWRLFRSSNAEVITHENLLVSRREESKAVTVTSYLSSETLGKYAEKYPQNADFQKLYQQPVTVDLVVTGTQYAQGNNEGRVQAARRALAARPTVTVSFSLSGRGMGFAESDLKYAEGSTVYDVFSDLLAEHGYTCKRRGSYIAAITSNSGITLEEFDEGKNSGWMYRVNGELVGRYMSAQGLKDGDRIELYFTSDWTSEPGAEGWQKPGKIETIVNADGSVTKIETKSDGTVIETTTWRDGSTLTAETSPNGRVETVEKRADGTTVETVEPVSGEITASVSVPKSVGSTRVDIPVSKPSGSMVAVIVHPDGTEEIVRGSVVTETGIALRAEGNVRLKIIDNAKRFNDMADHWAKDAVEFASSRELFNGVGNDAFGPDLSMTRGMVSTVLARLAGADTAGGETWYAKGTVWAVENGISDGTNPEQPVTREQLAAMLYRYAGSPAVSGELGFDDADSISAWARDAVRWCVDNGILNGVGGNRMTPQDLARRGQVAAMLMRFLQATV